MQRFRSRRRGSPQGPPKDTRPPLKPSPLPLVLPGHQHTLSRLGWTTVTFPQHASSSVPPSSLNASTSTAEIESLPGPHPLQKAYEDLFEASQRFFHMPVEEKQKWKHKLGSEEGWSSIPGEKEFITLRTLSYTPDVLKEPAKRYWDLMGTYLDSCLGRISASLSLSDDGEEGLRRYVGRCKNMGYQDEQKTATMLRLFRYEGWEEKIVAEPHADLGLLSCVVGNVPGLEVWNGRQFWDVERNYKAPCATLLGGRQLERLTNFRYAAGGHRVVSYGKPHTSSQAKDGTLHQADIDTPQYRLSIVFVLRAHEPTIVNTDTLTTDITGAFQKPVRDIAAGKWYEEIRGAHFNINTGMEERDEQRRKIMEKKRKDAEMVTEAGNGNGAEKGSG